MENMLNAAGIPITRKTYMTVSGDLLVSLATTSSQPELTAAENRLRAALAVPYRDLVLFCDDGTRSSVLLTNANTLSGVVITKGPDFQGDRSTGEFATRRHFEFEAMVETVIVGAQTQLMNFRESLEFYGGGPMFMMCRAVNAPPQRQMTWAQTEYTVMQSGEAIGLLAYPRVPPPKFPGFLKEAPRIKQQSPDRIGRNYRNFGVTWNYSFESARPLVAAPTLWT